VVPGATPARAPTRSAKYSGAYGVATIRKKPRSIVYFTSREVTSRLTGGENRTPRLSRTVTVSPSGATSGGACARSGVTWPVGEDPSSGRCAAVATIWPKV
jgi:hypothetical protein